MHHHHDNVKTSNGDWTTYPEADEELAAYLERMEELFKDTREEQDS